MNVFLFTGLLIHFGLVEFYIVFNNRDIKKSTVEITSESDVSTHNPTAGKSEW